MTRIAVVTGANRGLGFETCRQLALKDYQVILTSRDEGNGKKAAEKLAKENLKVIPYTLDVTQKNQIVKLKETLVKLSSSIPPICFGISGVFSAGFFITLSKLINEASASL